MTSCRNEIASRFSRPAVLVRQPLALAARVVEVEHARHGVDPQAVDVELLEPVHGVRDEEVAHLAAAEVEDVGAPVGLLAAAGVGMLVHGHPVEPAERPLVLGEVRRHPVHDHADARLVQPVDEVAQVVGRAEAGGRREVARHLVAPGGSVGMLGERHELDVGEPELGHVLDERLGDVAVSEARPPRAEVHLVHAHGAVVRVGARAARHPLVVAPGVGGVVGDDRGGGGRQLGAAGHGVGARHPLAGGGEDLELVRAARGEAGHEELPDAVVVEAAHGVLRAVPAVEVADDAHGLGIGRPHGEARALDALVRPVVRAEHVPELLVTPLAPEVEVDLADARHEAVRVVGRPVGAAVVARDDRVGLALGRPAGQHAVPEPVGVVGERHAAAVGAHDGHAGRERPQHPHDPAVVERMLPERVVRARVAALDERAPVIGVQRRDRLGGGGRARQVGHQMPFGYSMRRMCTGSTNALRRT